MFVIVLMSLVTQDVFHLLVSTYCLALSDHFCILLVVTEVLKCG